MPVINFPLAQFERAVTEDITTYTRRVDIYEADNTTLFARGVGLVSGSITIDLTSTERRTTDLVLSNHDGRLNVGRDQGFWYDKVVKVVMGIDHPTEGHYESAIGTFLVDRIASTNQSDELRVTARDFTKKLQAELPFAVSWAINTQIEGVISTLASGGGIPPSQTNLGVTPQFITKDLSFSVGADRWGSIKEVANTHGYDVFFDHDGILQLESFTDPATALPQFTFQTGQFSNIAAVRREIADKFIRNHQVVTGEDIDGNPVWGEAFNTTPDSPTRIGRLGFRTETESSSWITTHEQALELANHKLAYSSLESYETTLDTVLIPWLDVNVTAEFADPAIIAGDPTRYLLNRITIPLDLKPAEVRLARVTNIITRSGLYPLEDLYPNEDQYPGEVRQ